jgi:post-segregation antitoxin (ccd killing protein)
MRLDKYSKKESNSNHTSNASKLKHIVNAKREQEWLEENKETIEKQNERMEREGSFSEAYRKF